MLHYDDKTLRLITTWHSFITPDYKTILWKGKSSRSRTQDRGKGCREQDHEVNYERDKMKVSSEEIKEKTLRK